MNKYLMAPGFANIPIRDLPVWVKVFKKEGITSAEEMLKDLTLIDDLLTLQKSQSLLNRKRRLKDQMEDRIGTELGIARSCTITHRTKITKTKKK